MFHHQTDWRGDFIKIRWRQGEVRKNQCVILQDIKMHQWLKKKLMHNMTYLPNITPVSLEVQDTPVIKIEQGQSVNGNGQVDPYGVKKCQQLDMNLVYSMKYL